MFIRQTQPFLKRFCKGNIFECFRENRAEKSHSHQNLRKERREVLIMMRMKPQDHSSQRAEPAEYSKQRRSSRYTLWEACRV